MENLVTSWNHFNFSIAIIIFFVYICIDGMWAYYTISVGERKPVTAATVGAIMYFFMAFGIINYVQNYLYLIPLALGSWIGTYLVVRRDIGSHTQSRMVN